MPRCTLQMPRCLCSRHSGDGGEDVVPKDTGDSVAREEKPRIKVQLAKPKGKEKTIKMPEQEMKSNSSSSESESSSDSSDSSDDEGQVKPEMISAAKNVAKALGGDVQQTESDLLSQLHKHQNFTDSKKKGVVPKSTTNSIKELFSGMKVERKEPKKKTLGKQDWGKSSIMDQLKGSRKHIQRKRSAQVADVKLYEGSAMGIFTAKQSSEVAKADDSDLFTLVEKEELAKACTFPPPNAFDEMVLLTREGKIWKFPIDNEYGLDEEAKVGFHEHVFLDHMLSDFPEKGPVRIFMELVIVGLSKNPYLSVHQKQEHVTWFRDYFEEKRHVLEELMRSGEDRSPKEIQ